MSWFSISRAVRRLCKTFPILAIIWCVLFAVTVAFYTAFFVQGSNTALFVVEATTSRLQFKTATPERSSIFVQNVNLQSGNAFLKDNTKTDPQAFCFSGYVTPLKGATLDFGVLEGRQNLRILPEDGQAAGSVSFLTNGWALVDLADPQVGRSEGSESTQDLLNPGAQPTDMVLTDAINIAASELCQSADTSTGVSGFAPRAEPISVDGGGSLGRGLRISGAGQLLVDTDLQFISGRIQTVVRQVLCQETFFTLWGRAPNTSCNRVYVLSGAPLTIPSGSALRGVTTDSDIRETAVLFGQAYFDGEMYQVNVSTEAQHLEIIGPGATDRQQRINQLSISIFDRASSEPWLVAITGLFLTMTGLIVGILQVEDRRPNTPTPTPSSKRPHRRNNKNPHR
ncbi:hypothetical protein ACIRQ6_18080 [Algirhabdus cladophorae]